MDETIFTKIIKGEIPSHKIYEDDVTYAFLDIHPVTEGHVLVIPKKQVEWIWDLPENDYEALMRSVKKVGTRIKEVLNVPHVGMLVEGTGVPHVHVHLVPFVHGHEMRVEADMSLEPDHAKLAEIAEKIRF